MPAIHLSPLESTALEWAFLFLLSLSLLLSYHGAHHASIQAPAPIPLEALDRSFKIARRPPKNGPISALSTLGV